MSSNSHLGAKLAVELQQLRPEALLLALGEPALLLNGEGRILAANKAAERFLDRTSGLAGLTLAEFLLDRKVPPLPDVDEGPRLEAVTFHTIKDESRQGFLDLSPLSGVSGRLLLSRLRLVSSASPERDPFRTLFEEVMAPIFIKDTRSRFLAVNSAMAQVYNLDREEFVGLTDRDLISDEINDRIIAEDAKVLAGERTEDTRERIIAGLRRSFHVVKTPLRDGDGKIYGICGIAREVTRERELEVKLNETSGRLQALAEHLPGAIFTYLRHPDGGMTRLYGSPGYARILGVNLAKQLLSGEVHHYELIHPDDLAVAEQMDRDEETGDLLFNVEYRIRNEADEYKWVHIHSRGIPQENGDVLWHGFLLDIHDRKQAEEQLRLHSETLEQNIHSLNEAKLQAENAAQARGQFLANMSHEIRTPLTAVLGYAEILSDRLTDEDNRDALSVIEKNGKHLLQVINDILDLSKIEAGCFELAQETIDPAGELRDVVKLMQLRAAEKKLRLDLELIDPIPRRIEGDPMRLRQILINLIGNAIKFTERGEVTVRAEICAGESQALCIEVIDTGIGIDPKDMDRLFEAFHQVDNTTSRTHGGTGLGLTISRHLIGLMGGALSVSSHPGEGSCFQIMLPVKRRGEPSATTEPPADAIPERLEGRVLLAEDNRANQHIIKTLLTKVGCTVELAQNGREALERATTARDTGEPYDLILMDIQMPEMDGYEATRTLRADGFTLPIIALTAHALPEDRRRCLEAGCDEHCTKPIDRKQLMALLARHLCDS